MSICIWYFAKLAQKKTCLHNDSNYALYIVSRTKCCSTFGFSRDEKMNEASKAKTLKGGEGLSQTLFLIQMSIYRQNSTKVLSKGLTLKCFSRKVIGKLHSQSLLIKKVSSFKKFFHSSGLSWKVWNCLIYHWLVQNREKNLT